VNMKEYDLLTAYGQEMIMFTIRVNQELGRQYTMNGIHLVMAILCPTGSLAAAEAGDVGWL